MTDITPYDALPVDVVEAPPARPRLLLIGTVLASLAVTMGFAGLIGIYAYSRSTVIQQGGTWLPSGVEIPLTQPNMMMFTLVFSAATMAWATQAIRNDDRGNFHIATALTLVLGFAFIAQTGFLLSIMELEAAGTPQAVLIYSVVGTHLVLMVAAMAYVLGMAFRAFGGEYSAKDLEGVYGASMFWYTTVGLYLVLWYAIYITK